MLQAGPQFFTAAERKARMGNPVIMIFAIAIAIAIGVALRRAGRG